MKKEDLIVEIKKYLAEITVINDQLSTYLDILDCIKNPDYLNKMNQAPAFFTLIILALKSSIVMGVSRLYDSNKDSKTIQKLINKSQSNSNSELFDNKLRQDFINEDNQSQVEVFIEKGDINGVLKRFIKELETIQESDWLRNIKDGRDKVLAHNDKKYFLNPESVPEIPVSDILKLTEFATKVCNEMLKYLNSEAVLTKSSNVGDLYKLIESIKS